MAKNLEQCRVCRRAGTKLYLKGDRCFTPKCGVVKRNYAPGAQGAKKGGRPPRLTPYGVQLREKQKAKFYYGVSEKQFSNYFKKASSKVGDTSEYMLTMLEMRLDSTIFRLGWVWSRRDARQLVAHGAFLVNGRKVTIPSYQVKVGDILTVHASKVKNKHFSDVLPGLEKHTVSDWLYTEKGVFQAKVVSVPNRPEDTVAIFDMKPIIEFYSR